MVESKDPGLRYSDPDIPQNDGTYCIVKQFEGASEEDIMRNCGPLPEDFEPVPGRVYDWIPGKNGISGSDSADKRFLAGQNSSRSENGALGRLGRGKVPEAQSECVKNPKKGDM